MTIKVAREPQWVIPEGNYKASCIDASQFTQNQKGRIIDLLRLLFELHIPTKQNVQYLAQKKYQPTLEIGSELRSDLTNWLGREFLLNNQVFTPASLVGQEADLQISNIFNEGWTDPYVLIRAIFPPGTLVHPDTRSPVVPPEPLSNN